MVIFNDFQVQSGVHSHKAAAPISPDSILECQVPRVGHCTRKSLIERTKTDKWEKDPLPSGSCRISRHNGGGRTHTGKGYNEFTHCSNLTSMTVFCFFVLVFCRIFKFFKTCLPPGINYSITLITACR